MRLERLKLNLKINEEERENDRCPECKSSKFIWDLSRGDIICSDCGVVLPFTIQSNDWTHDNTDRNISCGVAGRETESPKSFLDSTYIRYFHFNEVLATLTLSGPWINNADFREIKNLLVQRGLTHPSRSDVQDVCRKLNQMYKVQRFTKKYSEKWIQIVYRFNGKRPTEIHPNVIHGIRRDFRLISSKWEQVKTFLTTTKKGSIDERRVQWPNYLETMYRLLKRRYPDVLPSLKPWITRLSKRKRKELKMFFEKVFNLVGL